MLAGACFILHCASPAMSAHHQTSLQQTETPRDTAAAAHSAAAAAAESSATAAPPAHTATTAQPELLREDDLYAVKHRIEEVEEDIRDTIGNRKACVTGSEDWRTFSEELKQLREELKQLRDKEARKEVALDRATSAPVGESHLLCMQRGGR
jgi:IS5 family transposase